MDLHPPCLSVLGSPEEKHIGRTGGMEEGGGTYAGRILDCGFEILVKFIFDMECQFVFGVTAIERV